MSIEEPAGGVGGDEPQRPGEESGRSGFRPSARERRRAGDDGQRGDAELERHPPGLPEEAARLVVEHPGLNVDLVAQGEPDATGDEQREDPPGREHGYSA
jgi:hypothetical protein